MGSSIRSANALLMPLGNAEEALGRALVLLRCNGVKATGLLIIDDDEGAYSGRTYTSNYLFGHVCE
jgi:hypothetical protein